MKRFVEINGEKSRKILWNCEGNKSLSSQKRAGVKSISMEEFYDE